MTKAKFTRQTHELDASGQAAGRLASQIACLLMGKHKAEYTPQTDVGDRVKVINAKKLKFTGKKLDQKKYYHYSGYPGGLKTARAKDLFAADPAQIIQKAVRSMVPANRLRVERLKRLTIK